MGLQNVPEPYPCVTVGKAIYKNNGEVDCEKTREAGNCKFSEKGLFCSYPGKLLLGALDAINYPDAGFLYEKIPAEKLGEISGDVARYLDLFKEEHNDWDTHRSDIRPEEESCSSYGDIIETIEEGIDWLSKLSNFDCELIPYR